MARMVAAAHRALGGIDVLVNNAGTARRDPFLTIAAADWDRIVAVNLRGMFLVAQAVSRHMVERGGGGVIINMSSTNGLAGEQDYAHYNASKGGVLLLTKTMAVELGSHGIRVNALCPGLYPHPARTRPFPLRSAGPSSKRPTPAIGYRSGGPARPRRWRPPTRSSPPTTPRSSTAPRWSSTAASSR